MDINADIPVITSYSIHYTKLYEAEAAESLLLEAGYGSRINVQSFELLSTGSGITLWSGYCGGSALGERGLPAEKVGRRAAEEIVSELSSKASVDVHLADQLIPYMALAGNSSYTRNNFV